MNLNMYNNKMDNDSTIWNTFVSYVIMNEIPMTTKIQKSVVLVFWYDAEVNNGGHSGYFDCYSEVKSEELVQALNEVGAQIFVDNFLNAYLYGKQDDYLNTDENFGFSHPTLTEVLQKYVIGNCDKILGNL